LRIVELRICRSYKPGPPRTHIGAIIHEGKKRAPHAAMALIERIGTGKA
jgi:hypothetical protein